MLYGHHQHGSICFCLDSLVIPASRCSCMMICFTLQVWQVHLHILFWYYSNVFPRYLFKMCFTFLLILEETREVWDVPLVWNHEVQCNSLWPHIAFALDGFQRFQGFFFTHFVMSCQVSGKKTLKNNKGLLPFLKETKIKNLEKCHVVHLLYIYFGLVW